MPNVLGFPYKLTEKELEAPTMGDAIGGWLDRRIAFEEKHKAKLAQEEARQELARRQVVETARQQPEPAAEAAPAPEKLTTDALDAKAYLTSMNPRQAARLVNICKQNNPSFKDPRDEAPAETAAAEPEPAAEVPPAPAPEAAPEEEAPAPISDEWAEIFDEAAKGIWDSRWSTEQEEFLVDWVRENGGARETTDWAACAAAMNAANLGVNRTAKQCLTRIVSLRRNQFRGAREALRAADERADEARVAREAAEAEAEAQYEKDRRKPRSDDDMEFHMASMEVAQLLANGEEVPARLQHLVDDA